MWKDSWSIFHLKKSFRFVGAATLNPPHLFFRLSRYGALHFLSGMEGRHSPFVFVARRHWLLPNRTISSNQLLCAPGSNRGFWHIQCLVAAFLDLHGEDAYWVWHVPMLEKQVKSPNRDFFRERYEADASKGGVQIPVTHFLIFLFTPRNDRMNSMCKIFVTSPKSDNGAASVPKS